MDYILSSKIEYIGGEKSQTLNIPSADLKNYITADDLNLIAEKFNTFTQTVAEVTSANIDEIISVTGNIDNNFNVSAQILTDNINTLATNIETVSGVIDNVNKKYDDVIMTSSELSDDIDDINVTINETLGLVNATVGKINNINGEIEEYKGEINSKIDELETISSADEKIYDATKNLATRENLSSVVEETLADIKANPGQILTGIEDLKLYVVDSYPPTDSITEFNESADATSAWYKLYNTGLLEQGGNVPMYNANSDQWINLSLPFATNRIKYLVNAKLKEFSGSAMRVQTESYGPIFYEVYGINGNNLSEITFTATEKATQIVLNYTITDETEAELNKFELYYRTNFSEELLESSDLITNTTNGWEKYTIGTVITLANADDKVQFRNFNSCFSTKNNYYTFKISSGAAKVSGNINALINYNNNIKNFTIPEYAFYRLFNNCTGLIDATDLRCDANILSEGCYAEMFAGCSNLLHGPVIWNDNYSVIIPANCCKDLYKDCENLESGLIPQGTKAGVRAYYQAFYNTKVNFTEKLIANEVTDETYYKMFSNCTELTTAPKIEAKKYGNESCYQMFYENTKLIDASNCFSTKVQSLENADRCFFEMFKNCTALTNLPALTATTLSTGCYDAMFENCKSIINGLSILPATELQTNCYYKMFKDCSNLHAAPVLPATKLVDSCYAYMFENCSALKYIKVYFTGWNPANATTAWVDGIPETGLFNCPVELPKKYGINYMLENWYETNIPLTIRNAGFIKTNETGISKVSLIPSIDTYFDRTFIIDTYVNGQFSTKTVHIKGKNIYVDDVNVSTDGNFIEYLCAELPNKGDYVQITNTSTSLSVNETNYFTFNIENMYAETFGNTNSLLNFRTDNIPAYSYFRLFKDCTTLLKAPELPTLILYAWCYYEMFAGCTALTQAPLLPATTIYNGYNYARMFADCTSLEVAPDLLATFTKDSALNNIYVYAEMFKGSGILKTPKIAVVNIPCLGFVGMFSNCTNLTEFTGIDSATYVGYLGCIAMFKNCIKLKTLPKKLMPTQIESSAYYEMFENCELIEETPELPEITLKTNSSIYNYWGMARGRNVMEKTIEYSAENGYPDYWNARYFIGMFKNCKQLKKVSDILVNSTNYYCIFSEMFSNCTELVNPPKFLFKTTNTIGELAFAKTFYNCYKLEAGPDLSDFVPNNKYGLSGMFENCVGLTELYLPKTYTSWNTFTTDWVKGVENPSAANIVNKYGTLYKSANLLPEQYDDSHIPYGWDIKNYKQIAIDEINKPLTFMPFENISVQLIPHNNFNLDSLYYRKADTNGNVTDWEQYTSGTVITQTGNSWSRTDYPYVIEFKNENNDWSTSETDYCTFAVTGCFEALGNIQSLMNNSKDVNEYSYYKLFENCSGLISSPRLTAPTLKHACYKEMFNGCTGLLKLNCDFDSWNNAEDATENWVNGVSANIGAFLCSTDWKNDESLSKNKRTKIKFGKNFIPDGWNIFDKEDYLTFTSLDDGAQLQLCNYNSANWFGLEYKTSNDNHWYKYPINEKIQLNENETIQFRNKYRFTGYPYNWWGNSVYQYLYFQTYDAENSLAPNSKNRFKASGNIQSLLNFYNIVYHSCYYKLFHTWNTGGATGLVSAPELPATCLHPVKIGTVDIFPPTEGYAYHEMFRNYAYSFSVLEEGPSILPATTVNLHDYSAMFADCEKLKKAPIIKATNFTGSANLSGMFQNCVSLSGNIDELPAKKLTPACYRNMFFGCSNLVKAPKLPATDLADSCYFDMFWGCVSLETAPYLPAKNVDIDDTNTTATDAYYGIFAYNNNLKYVHINTDSFNNRSNYWLTTQADSGIDRTEFGTVFVPEFGKDNLCKNSYLNSTYGLTATRKNWKIVSEDIIIDNNPDIDMFDVQAFGNELSKVPLTFITNKVTSKVTLNTFGNLNLDNNIKYRLSAKDEWLNYNIGDEIELSGLQYVQFKNISNTLSLNETDFAQFNISGACWAVGNIQSLLNNSETASEYCFNQLFMNCSGLIEAPSLTATKLKTACYKNMFNHCDKLMYLPSLPATTLADGCYENMFDTCSGLSIDTIHEINLPATELVSACYREMFQNTFANDYIKGNLYLHFNEWKDDINATDDMFVGSKIPSNTNIQSIIIHKPLSLNETITTNNEEDRWPMGFMVARSITDENKEQEPLTVETIHTNWNTGAAILGSKPANTDTLYTKNIVYRILNNTDKVIRPWQSVNSSYNYSKDRDWICILSPNAKSGTDSHRCGAGVKMQFMFLQDKPFDNINLTPAAESYTYSVSIISDIAAYTHSRVKVYGKLAAMSNYSEELDNTLPTNSYNLLFANSTAIKDISGIDFVSNKTKAGKYYLDGTFYKCTNLLVIPEYIPQNEMEIGAYAGMFSYCTSLEDTIKINTKDNKLTLSDNCFNRMYYGCTSLKVADEIFKYDLSKTIPDNNIVLASGCFENMFYGCTNLETAIALPYTPVTNNCYKRMFYNCTSLKNFSSLNNSTKTYELTDTISLPATQLASECYCGMFYNCYNLHSISVDFIDWNTAANSTYYWVYNVRNKFNQSVNI